MSRIFKDNLQAGELNELLSKHPNHRVVLIQEHRGNNVAGARYYSTYFVLLEANHD